MIGRSLSLCYSECGYTLSVDHSWHYPVEWMSLPLCVVTKSEHTVMRNLDCRHSFNPARRRRIYRRQRCIQRWFQSWIRKQSTDFFRPVPDVPARSGPFRHVQRWLRPEPDCDGRLLYACLNFRCGSGRPTAPGKPNALDGNVFRFVSQIHEGPRWKGFRQGPW